MKPITTYHHRITYTRDIYLGGEVYRVYDRDNGLIGRYRTLKGAEKAIESTPI